MVFVGLIELLKDIDKIWMNIYKPAAFAFSGVIFGLGVILGYFIPYLPTIIYIMAVIGWLLLVIEVMLAAPIIALGLANPTHHDLLGKAEQSLILLLMVFLRPACIMIGLVISMFMIYVSMEYLNMGFLYFIATPIGSGDGLLGLTHSQDGGVTYFVVFASILVMYTYLSYVIITRCLTLMYTIPENIARWLDPNKGDPQAIPMLTQQIGGIEQAMAGSGGGASKIGQGAETSSRRQIQTGRMQEPSSRGLRGEMPNNDREE